MHIVTTRLKTHFPTLFSDLRIKLGRLGKSIHWSEGGEVREMCDEKERSPVLLTYPPERWERKKRKEGHLRGVVEIFVLKLKLP